MEAEEKERRQVRRFQWLDSEGRIERKPMVAMVAIQANSLRKFYQKLPHDQLSDVFFGASCEFLAVPAKHEMQICVFSWFERKIQILLSPNRDFNAKKW